MSETLLGRIEKGEIPMLNGLALLRLPLTCRLHLGESMFPMARALRSNTGAPIGEIFTFLSGLYFRGKLAYAAAFARPPPGMNSGVFVITPNRGLLAPSVRLTLTDLADLAKTAIDPSAEAFRSPLRRDAEALAERLGRAARLFCWAA